MLRKSLLILLCFAIMASVTSCYDSNEADDWAYVYSVGVDNGTVGKLRFTVQIPKASLQTGGGGASQESGVSNEGGYVTVSVDCPTIAAGIDMINTSLSRTLNFMHTKYFIVSEEFAREGVESVINGTRRMRQVRRIMHFIVVKGDASIFIKKFQPVLGVALSKMQESMMRQSEKIGLFDDTTYGEFINNMKSTKQQPSCAMGGLNDLSTGSKQSIESGAMDYGASEIPRSGGNSFEFIGMALFNGDKMVGELTGEEAKIVMMARNKLKAAQYTIMDPSAPGEYVALEIYPQKPAQVAITFEEGIPMIHLKIFMEGDLKIQHSDTDYGSEERKLSLEESFSKSIKEKLDKILEKCQNLNSDIFGFGDKASIQFSTIQEWEEYDWKTQFKEAVITTEVELAIKRPGTVMRTNPTRKAEEQEE